MTSVLISDDHVVVRHGLRQILSEELEDTQFGEAGDAEEVMSQVQQRQWDMLVLDISMPGKSGLEILRDVRQIRPKLPVLVLSVHPESQYAVRVLKAGAAGYMTKDSPRDELVRAVRRVLSGGKYVSETLAETLASDLGQPADRPLHQTLSDREYEVLRGIATGKSISGIAAELELSIKTVSTYRRRVLEKLRMTSNAEIVRYALENRMFSS